MSRVIKFEYGFESVNGIVKKVYSLFEIPFITENCDVWGELPIVYVRQYTGLLDKNGKEIYEGDILRWESSNPFSLGELRTVRVEYIQAQYWCQGIGRMFGKFGVYLAELLSNERVNVIGNIHEHKHLLE